MDDILRNLEKYGASHFGFSEKKNKRFYVAYNNKIIHFGSKTNNTYIDHGDKKKRDAWRARHSKILLKNGTPAYLDKKQPEFWSYHILW